MNVEYVAKKSAWGAVTLFSVLFCWLIIPLLIMIFRIIAIKSFSIEFYHDYIITKSGVFSKKEQRTSFMGVVCVNMEQSLMGRIFKYGTLRVDIVGKHDFTLDKIADPKDLKQYLETRTVLPTSTVLA